MGLPAQPALNTPVVVVTRTRPEETSLPAAAPPAVNTPTPFATQTVPPAPTPTLHPMTIAAMRQLEYPGSEITLVEELDRGINYRRLYVNYLSEGNKIYALLTIPGRRNAAYGLARDRIQPRIHPARSVSNHGTIHLIRGLAGKVGVRGLSHRLPRP
ncbi:MAG: hypothetical protein M5U05_10065 [Anaerolineales bacterium]|nr:hypothetical protein [Anaerolineales bacterium]